MNELESVVSERADLASRRAEIDEKFAPELPTTLSIGEFETDEEFQRRQLEEERRCEEINRKQQSEKELALLKWKKDFDKFSTHRKTISEQIEKLTNTLWTVPEPFSLKVLPYFTRTRMCFEALPVGTFPAYIKSARVRFVTTRPVPSFSLVFGRLDQAAKFKRNLESGIWRMSFESDCLVGLSTYAVLEPAWSEWRKATTGEIVGRAALVGLALGFLSTLTDSELSQYSRGQFPTFPSLTETEIKHHATWGYQYPVEIIAIRCIIDGPSVSDWNDMGMRLEPDQTSSIQWKLVNGHDEPPEENAAKTALSSLVGCLLNVHVEPFLASLPLEWIDNLSDAAAAFASKTDDDIWVEFQSLLEKVGNLLVRKSSVLAEITYECGIADPIPKRDLHLIIENWGRFLLGVSGAATREEVAKGRLLNVLVAGRWNMKQHEDSRREIPLPVLSASILGRGMALVSVPNWDGNADSLSLLNCLPNAYMSYGGKMIPVEMYGAFAGSETWKDDASSVADKLFANGSGEVRIVLKKLSDMLNNASRAENAEALQSVFDSIDFDTLFSTKESAR